MKSKTAIGLIIFVLLLIAVKFLFLSPTDKKSNKAGNQNAAFTTVSAYVVQTLEQENNIYSSGTALANEEVILRPEVSGKLIGLYFQDGSIVEKGTLLAKINDADLKAQLKKLDLQYQLASEKNKRLKSLLEINGISTEEVDESSNQLFTLQADKDFINAQLAKTEIRAPFTGNIGLRQVSEGSLVSSSTIIATMQQRNILKIDFSVPEKYTTNIAVGDLVQFNVDNNPDTLMAKVIATESRIDEQTRNLMVRALYNNKENKIVPGSFARVRLITKKKANVIMIPTQAVIPELKGKKVFVVKQGKAQPVKVVTGVRTDSKIEIVSGLNQGDTVIVTGILSLKPEAPVKIVNYNNK